MYRLFESSGIGFVIVSPDQAILDANLTFCKKIGDTREELLKLSISSLTHPDDLKLTSNLFQHVREQNLIQVFDKRYMTKTGDTLWCKLRS